MPCVLLVDGNPLVWRAAYAERKSSQESRIAGEVVRYFYEILERFRPQEVVICWDRGKSRWRSLIYPDYKADRLEKKREDVDLALVKEQMGYVRRYFNAVGVRQITIPGVEADDVLGWLSEYYSLLYNRQNPRIVIATGDRDLWQLVSSRVLVYDHLHSTLFNEQGVESAFGVEPERVADLKSLMGDASDNIPGVKGIGAKTGAKLLAQYEHLGTLCFPDKDQIKELSKRKTTARILESGELIAETYRLVKIPSLREAIYYLSPAEMLIFKEEVEKPLAREDFRVRMMYERFGKSYAEQERLLPTSSADLKGMVNYMENCAPSERPSWGSLLEVDNAMLECAQCELRSHCAEFGPTLPSGHENCEIMIVGRNPGEQELINRKPFFPGAPAGSRLEKFLANVGLIRDECWVTNTCKCYSQDNRPPTFGEIKACSRYLRAEIDLLRPKFIIAFGNEAMMQLTPYRSRVRKHCGEILESPTGMIGQIEAKVAVCVHPSSTFRNQQDEKNMQYAEKMVKNLLDKVTEDA